MDRSRYNRIDGSGDYRESSVKTPDFQAKRKLGLPLPINPYLWNRWDFTHRPVYLSGIGTVTAASMLDPPITVFERGFCAASNDTKVYCQKWDNLTSIVTNRLLDRVRDKDIDLGVAFGEYRETANLIANTCAKVAKAVRLARKRRFSEAMRALTGSSKRSTWKDVPKAAANTWLGVTYGLKPLLSDIFDGIRIIENRHRNKALIPVHTVKAFHGVDINVESVVQYGKPDYWRYARGTSVSGKIRGVITFEVDNPFLYLLTRMGLTNPLSVAYELMTLSFVLDWFTNLGKTIDSIVPPQGVKFVSGYIMHNLDGWSDASGFSNRGYYDGTVHQRYKRRDLLTAFPRYHVIKPDISLSKEQVASGISLVIQAILGGRKSG